MSEKLKKIIADTQAQFIADPESAKTVFTSVSSLQQGLHSEAKMRDHTVTVDEPEQLGGTDKGPNPVELVLAAPGTCQEITYRAYAAALSIPVDSISVKLEGDINLCGFFGVDDSVRPGFQSIKGTVDILSPASDEQLKALRGAVNAHCPVLDIVTKPVPVTLDLNISKSESIAAD